MELNIMFLARSTFIFDSWPYTKDENGTLHHRLMETTIKLLRLFVKMR